MMEVYRFKRLDRWDSFTIPHLNFPPRIPSARLGDILARRNEPVDRAKHKFADLQPITIHFNGDVSRRPVKEGRDYTMPLMWVRPTDLVLSTIDLKNGAVGVLPHDWSNAVVTTHFAVYEPDTTRVHPLYLRYLIQTSGFKRWLWSNRSGADGRTEVKLPVFESLEVPLPDLAEQQAIVAAYETALAGAAAKEAEAATAEAAALAAFEAALGFAPPAPLPDRPVFVASFKDLDRWSHEGVLRRVTGGAASTAPWPMVSLRDIIAGLEVGWSPKALDRPAYGGEWGVLKLGAVSFGSFDPSANKALRSGTSPRQACEVKTGDILISRGNVARLVASCVLVDATPQRLMIPDLIFRVVGLRSEAVEPAFLVAALRTGFVRNQVAGRLTGTSPTMKKISTGGLLSLTFPLPPLDRQRALVAALDAGRTAAATLRREAAEARAAAWAAFEAAVYASEPAAMGQKEAA